MSDPISKYLSSSNKNSNTLNLEKFEEDMMIFLNDSTTSMRYKAKEAGFGYDNKKKLAKCYRYDGTESITICPEPIEFLKEFDEFSDDVSQCDILFRKKLLNSKKISLDKPPVMQGKSNKTKIWINKTLDGICLRLGTKEGDTCPYKPVVMSDDNVHGLIVGRTGSGKSVFVNALILSLITEYAPWELNLYLADFKKVELSRYMNNGDNNNNNTPFTPHVMACAATSEIRYVISMIKHLVNSMVARNEFFARLGVTKLQEFREKYNVVLPRVLLIVDEFQQMFTEATPREQEELQVMLNSITKLGRATGFHLIFASQEMSGTLRGNTLANFKIRMALPCNSDISTSILGNSKASELQRGYIFVNTEGGDEIYNNKYRVPFIQTEVKTGDDYDSEKTPFYKYLDIIKKQASLYPFRSASVQKFYREDLQEDEKSFRRDLDKIRDKKNLCVKSNDDVFDAVVLGSTVLYSTKKNDKVSFYIEKGQNKSIMIATPDFEFAARIRKLLAENLMRSNQSTKNICIEQNPLIYAKFKFDDFVKKYPAHSSETYGLKSGIDYLIMLYLFRQSTLNYIKDHSDDLNEFRVCYSECLSTIADDQLISEYLENKLQKEKLENEIYDLKRISEPEKSKTKHGHPIEDYLKLCSENVIIIPKENKPASMTLLPKYKDVVGIFASESDISVACDESKKIIDKAFNECRKSKETRKQVEAIMYLVFKKAISYYSDCFMGKEAYDKDFGKQFQLNYDHTYEQISQYKQNLEMSGRTTELLLTKTKEYNEICRKTTAIDRSITFMEKTANEILGQCYKEYTKKNNEFPTKGERKLSVEFSLIRDGITYKYIADDNISAYPCLTGCVSDVVSYLIDSISKDSDNTIKSDCFQKYIFWINGIDELVKTPKGLDNVLRDAINMNILVIAIATSELRDILLRKAFDYAFVTGNIPKFYEMFGLRYTKQELDSIVVNFCIRSKGLEIPFKIYKSDMSEVQTLSFVDDLLEE